MNHKGIHARVYGRVQGVGFRYSTYMQAKKIGLAGYVRNMSDGSVEVVAEGDENTINKFISWLKKGPIGSRVDNVELKSIAAIATYRNFTIEY